MLNPSRDSLIALGLIIVKVDRYHLQNAEMFDTVTMSHCFSFVVGSALPLELSFRFHWSKWFADEDKYSKP